MLEEAGLIEGRNLYDIANTQVVHHLNQALKANVMFKKDIDYIVKDEKVVIIDEFTGRMMDGRRWSDGLHQAVEAKEGVQIEPENQTLASITFQNYFRMYPKLSGMTGTAMTEAPEFFDIYKMNVVAIPTNVPVQRESTRTTSSTRRCRRSSRRSPRRSRRSRSIGQPVLVGTVSIEKSEMLSEYLEKEGVKHSVLNARFHEQEAHIVAQAGRMGAVTIATNMAGRGTDIQLGGNLEFRMRGRASRTSSTARPNMRRRPRRSATEIVAEKQRVLEVGGLYVLGTERHESRRIDNQLRGRSGRQGDPGLSKFYLSLDDDLLRIFGPQTMFSRLMNKNLEDGEAIVIPVDLEGDRDRAEEGRGAQLRHPQAGRRIRRRDERPAQGHLRAARRHHGRGERQRGHHATCAPRRWRRSSPSIVRRAPIPSSGTSRACKESIEVVLGLQPPIDQWLQEDAVDPEMIAERLQELADESMAAKLEELRARALGRRREADPDPNARPSLEGAPRDARRASPGHPPAAATPRRSRSTSISRRRSCCSSGCSSRSARKSRAS